MDLGQKIWKNQNNILKNLELIHNWIRIKNSSYSFFNVNNYIIGNKFIFHFIS